MSGNSKIEAQKAAHLALNQRSIFASLVLILGQTLVISLIFIGVSYWFGEPALKFLGPISALLLTTYQEIQARRRDRERLAPVRQLSSELIDLLEEPFCDWQMGFPYIRGKLEGKHVLCHFEGAEKGLDRQSVRVNLEVEAEAHKLFRLFGLEPEDTPEIFMEHLKKRWPERKSLNGTRLFSPEELGENGPFLSTEMTEAAAQLCHKFPPYSAGLDARGDGLLWDCRLTREMNAQAALEILKKLCELSTSLIPMDLKDFESSEIKEKSQENSQI